MNGAAAPGEPFTIVTPIGDPKSWKEVTYKYAEWTSRPTISSSIALAEFLGRRSSVNVELDVIFFRGVDFDKFKVAAQALGGNVHFTEHALPRLEGRAFDPFLVSAAIALSVAKALVQGREVWIDLTHGWNVMPVFGYIAGGLACALAQSDVGKRVLRALMSEPVNSGESLRINEIPVSPLTMDWREEGPKVLRFVKLFSPENETLLKDLFLSFAYLTQGIVTYAYYHLDQAMRNLEQRGETAAALSEILREYMTKLENDNNLAKDGAALEGLSILSSVTGQIARVAAGMPRVRGGAATEPRLRLNEHSFLTRHLREPLKSVVEENIGDCIRQMSPLPPGKKRWTIQEFRESLRNERPLYRNSSSRDKPHDDRVLVAHSGLTIPPLKGDQQLSDARGNGFILSVNRKTGPPITDPLGFWREKM